MEAEDVIGCIYGRIVTGKVTLQLACQSTVETLIATGRLTLDQITIYNIMMLPHGTISQTDTSP